MAIKQKRSKCTDSGQHGLIHFDGKHLILISFLCCFFAAMLFSGLHGYSIPFWRDYVDGSAKEDILLGKAIVIRSDDWSVEVPMMLAQLSHNPKYPMVNENIGTGMNMLTHSKLPVKHVLTVFRPAAWGFFAGADFGLAWTWWTMVLGLFYVFFLVFMIISRNDFYLSLLGSLFLLFSSFFQFWSFHKAEIPIFAGLIFISFSYLCFSRRKGIIIAHAFVLGWALACYAVNFVYPPFQLSCAYLLLFMMPAIVADRYREYAIKLNWQWRLAGITTALLILAYAAITYYAAAGDIIKIMMNTTYPGQRFCVGGDMNPGILFREFFFTLFYITHTAITKWGSLGNICEASSFMFFFPPVIAAILWQASSGRKNVNIFSIIMTGYFLIILCYVLVGFPAAISKYSLFYVMQSGRTVLGLGIANAVILVSFLSCSAPRPSQPVRAIIAALWAAALFAMGKLLVKEFDYILPPYVAAASIVAGFITYYLLNTEKKKTVLAILVCISFAATAWFNPLVLKGASFAYQNQMSKQILEINRNENGNTQWAVFGTGMTPNLLRIIGIKSIGGTHSHPMLDLWGKFDPERQHIQAYNHYGHVLLEPSLTGSIKFHSPDIDQLTVYINPNSDVLHKMNVTHVLALDENIAFFDRNTKFKKLWSLDNKAIYKVDPNITP
ncbi:MAG: DUF7657 domain-containing protein [Victivallaceae bacterium]